MEPSLMVIGLNHRTAPVAMRERFWINESRRYEALRQLLSAEGIEEVVVLATCSRTEFLLWASEPTSAANSVLHFLATEHGLKLREWEHFYRLLDEAALIHLLRVASSLDSVLLGEPQIVSQLKSAWEQARTVGSTGRFLDVALQKAMTVSRRVHSETAIGDLAVSIPSAALKEAQRIFGSVEGRKVLLLGAGKINEVSARHLLQSGAGSFCVIDRSLDLAQQLAQTLGGTAAGIEDRWRQLLQADIVICSTGCPHIVLSREEAELIVSERKQSPLLIFDMGMPRDIDPTVRAIKGVVLQDLDDLERAAQFNPAERLAVAAEAEKIVAAEAQEFRLKLQAESVVPTIVALRRRLDEISHQELESYSRQHGPFTREQDHVLQKFASQLIQRIAGTLARELKELPEKVERERMTDAVQRLFHLALPPPGTPVGAAEPAHDLERILPVAVNH